MVIAGRGKKNWTRDSARMDRTASLLCTTGPLPISNQISWFFLNDQFAEISKNVTKMHPTLYCSIVTLK